MTYPAAIFFCLWIIAVTLAIIHILRRMDKEYKDLLQTIINCAESSYDRMKALDDRVTLVSEDAEVLRKDCERWMEQKDSK